MKKLKGERKGLFEAKHRELILGGSPVWKRSTIEAFIVKWIKWSLTIINDHLVGTKVFEKSKKSAQNYTSGTAQWQTTGTTGIKTMISKIRQHWAKILHFLKGPLLQETIVKAHLMFATEMQTNVMCLHETNQWRAVAIRQGHARR